jgi:hypothetical protein
VSFGFIIQTYAIRTRWRILRDAYGFDVGWALYELQIPTSTDESERFAQGIAAQNIKVTDIARAAAHEIKPNSIGQFRQIVPEWTASQ